MKTSIKIGIALIVIMLSGITYSNLGLKKQYDAIDKSDAFWNYDLREKLTFSKLQIEGGNRAHITIVKEKGKGEIAYNEDLKDLISYKVINDTLKIVFDKSLEEKSTTMVKRLKHRIGISYDDLETLEIKNGWASLQMEGLEDFKLNLSGASYLELKTESQALNAFDVSLDGNSQLNFTNIKSKILLKSLSVKVFDSSRANLETFYPEKTTLQVSENAKITLNAKTWNSSQIPNEINNSNNQ